MSLFTIMKSLRCIRWRSRTTCRAENGGESARPTVIATFWSMARSRCVTECRPRRHRVSCSATARARRSRSGKRERPRFSLMKQDTDFYQLGIDLFNEGRFFECHEAWEEIWKRADGELKLFYQGLIQAAVAILHAQRGNLEGARSLYEKASAKLDKIPHEHMGLAIGELRVELRRFIETATRANSAPLPDPPRLRRIPK